MNERNKKINIGQELLKGRGAMEEALVLFEKQLFSGAVSRVYYAAFHYLKALLFTIGLEPKTHEGALHLFSIHFIKTGRFPKEYARLIKKLKKDREDSDYKPTVVFSMEDAQKDIEDMKGFCRAIQEFLKQEGYL